MRKVFKFAVLTRRFFQLLFYAAKSFFKKNANGPVRLRTFFELSSGAFIKLGQILSLRQDFLSLAYSAELLKLLGRVPEAPFADMEKIFAEEIGLPMNKFFLEIDRRPIAAGSIAIVYRATLKNGGEKVAVKIQRPKIREKFESDFMLMSFFAGVFDFFRGSRPVKAKDVVAEFISWTRREFDFGNEMRQGDAIRGHSVKRERTIIPKQYSNLSTEKVLIQEYMENAFTLENILSGTVDAETLRQMSIDPESLAFYLIEEGMRQFFMHGLFHADPHPANIMVKSGNRLVYLDFGIVGEAKDVNNRLLFLKALYGVACMDIDLFARHFIDFGENIMERELGAYLHSDARKRKAVMEVIAEVKKIILVDFTKDMKGILEPWFKAVRDPRAALYEKSSSAAFFKVLRKSEKYGVRPPKEIILFFRTLSILDMVSLQMAPCFDTIRALQIFFEKYPIRVVEEAIIPDEKKQEMPAYYQGFSSKTGADWEFFMESLAARKERMLDMREKTLDLLISYAENHNELRKMIKKLK